ncbi:MAG: alanine racemase [Gemmatimonadaceae bacterium]
MPRESTPRTIERAWVEVDLSALLRNARAVAAHTQKPIIPMVKADAYGLGAVAVTHALETLEPLAYGVSSLSEAEELRSAGIMRPIILFTPSLPAGTVAWPADDLKRLIAARVTPTFGDAAQIRAWGASTKNAAWHLAVDTGMHRAGVNFDAGAASGTTTESAALDAVLTAAAEHPPEGVFTHFHSAELDNGSMEQQEERFRAVLSRLPQRPTCVHAENSAGAVRRSPSEWDAVRPGVFLYGVGSWRGAPAGGKEVAAWHTDSNQRTGLSPAPVASLRARILEIRTVQPGEGVSYDVTWRAGRASRIATVACGYADGLRRQLGNRAHAIVRERRVPIVGVVTMDMAMLDVTDIGAELGDVATFLGRSETDTLTVEDVAEAGGISPYELLTGLRQRLPRLYKGAI